MTSWRRALFCRCCGCCDVNFLRRNRSDRDVSRFGRRLKIQFSRESDERQKGKTKIRRRPLLWHFTGVAWALGWREKGGQGQMAGFTAYNQCFMLIFYDTKSSSSGPQLWKIIKLEFRRILEITTVARWGFLGVKSRLCQMAWIIFMLELKMVLNFIFIVLLIWTNLT